MTQALPAARPRRPSLITHRSRCPRQYQRRRHQRRRRELSSANTTSPSPKPKRAKHPPSRTSATTHNHAGTGRPPSITLLLTLNHGAILEARDGPQAGGGSRLGRAVPRCPTIPHGDVLLKTIPLDAAYVARTYHAALRRALRRHAQGPHSQGRTDAV